MGRYSRLILGTLIAIICLLPPTLGWVAKRQIVTALESIPSYWGIKVQLEQYKLGWLHSHAVFSVIPTSKEVQQAYFQYQRSKHSSNPAPLTLQLKQDISHGPILLEGDEFFEFLPPYFALASIKGRLELQDAQRKILEPFFKHKVLFEGITQIGFSGHWDTKFFAKMVRFSNKGYKGFVSGVKVALGVSSNLKIIDVTTSIDKISLTTPEKTVVFDDVAMTGNYQNVGFWAGATTLNLPFMMVSKEGLVQTIMKGASIELQQTSEPGIANIELGAEVDNFIFEQHNVGPGYYRVMLKNLDAEAFEQCCRQLFGDDYFNFAVNKQISESFLTHLISHGFQFTVNPFFINTPNGQMSIQAWLTLPESVAGEVVSLEQMLRSADGSFVVILPTKQIPMALDFLQDKEKYLQDPHWEGIRQWLENDLRTQIADPYKLSIAYRSGQFFVNGKLVDHSLKQK